MAHDTVTSPEHEAEDERLPPLAEAFVDDDGPTRRGHPVRRAVVGALICLVVLGLVVTTVVVAAGLRLSANLDRIPGVFDGLPDRPAKPASGPGADAVNILVMGTDRRSEVPTTGEDAEARSWSPGAQRTDTMMVLHLDGNREAASLISIPRDSWVLVPGYGMAKINAAFSYGGPSLAVATVENFTGVRIDHVAVTDWDGFSSLIDALGGVRVKVPETVSDSARDLTWSAGEHELDGEQALDYVGQRYGLPLGDLDRVRRQQSVLRAIATETLRRDPLGDPLGTYDLLATLTRHVSVDDDWSSTSMVSLLRSLSGMRGSDVAYLTAPVAGFGDESGQSVVRLDAAANRRLWSSVVTDDVQEWADRHRSEVTPAVVR